MKRVKELQIEAGTKDPFAIADFFGINTMYHSLGTVYGYYIKLKGMDFIVINRDKPKPVQRFAMCHELAHFFLHSHSTAFAASHTFLVTDKQELEANRFAMHLFIDDEEIETRPEWTIDNWITYTGLPREIVELRFEEVLL